MKPVAPVTKYAMSTPRGGLTASPHCIEPSAHLTVAGDDPLRRGQFG